MKRLELLRLQYALGLKGERKKIDEGKRGVSGSFVLHRYTNSPVTSSSSVVCFLSIWIPIWRRVGLNFPALSISISRGSD